MPPLELFGRQWRIASDDFVCPAIIEFFLRLLWILIIGIVLGFHLLESAMLDCLVRSAHCLNFTGQFS